MKKRSKIIFIAFISLSLIFFIVMTDMDIVFEQISKVGFGFMYILLISLLAYLAGAIAWKYCFVNSEIPFGRLLYTRTIGEMITLFNPTNIVAGEAYKHYALKTYVSDTSKIFDSIIISRALMILSQLILSIICLISILIFMIGDIVLLYSIAIMLFSMVLLLFIISVFSKNSYKIETLSSFPAKVKQAIGKLKEIVKRIKVHIRDNPWQISKAFYWSLIHWLLGAVEILLILHLLGFSTGFMNALTVDMGVVIMKSVGGFVPAQIGVEELSNKMMLNIIGLEFTGLWLSVSVLRRAKQVIWIGICFSGYSLLQFLKVKKYSNGDTLCNT